MVYVTVQEENGDVLRLSRSPSLRAWSVFVGLIAVGVGAAVFTTDSILWKFAYLTCTMFVALTTLENWEECVLDKPQGKVSVSSQTFTYKLFKASHGYKVVAGDLNDIVDVTVEKEDVKYGTSSYMVVLRFGAGFSIGVTETATSGDRSEHQLTAEKIYSFLDLENKPSSSTFGTLDLNVDSTDDDDNSLHSDESYEKIDRCDVPPVAEAGDAPTHPNN